MQFPEQEHLKCPRCDSENTKFCYYNNYNLSQPRHFCKNCRRYWTKGGALRNIPVGGGSRKNTKRSPSTTTKRSSSSTSSSSTSTAAAPSSSPKTEPYGPSQVAVQPGFDQNRRMINLSSSGINGSFSSLLSSSGGQLGNFLEGMHPNESNLHIGGGIGNHDPNQDPGLGTETGSGMGNGSNGNGSSTSCWNGSNGWPDLAIYSRGSNFQ